MLYEVLQNGSSFPVFLIIVLCILIAISLFALYMYTKRRRILKQLAHMEYSEKCQLLNSLAEPLGYQYICATDVFSTTLFAWQREFGYTALFDYSAAGLNMIFDCEPVYFNYRGRTWLIEFWKGQYGINVGGEVGIYHSDRILSDKELKTEVFQAVGANELMDMSLALRFHDYSTALRRRHWWLTVFCLGQFAHPRDISMEITLYFPDIDMQYAFLSKMLDYGYSENEFYVNGNVVRFTFRKSHTQSYSLFKRFHRAIVQKQNYILCKLYNAVTKPVDSTVDKLLFLYLHMPFVFNRTLQLHKYKRKRVK